MKNIKSKTIKFIQDEKKGVTVAILYLDQFEIYKEFNDIIQKDFPSINFDFNNLGGKFDMPRIIKAKTKLSQGDKFDPQKGIEVAKTKVLNKYYIKRAEYFRAALDDIEQIAARLSGAVKYNFIMAEKTAASISKYCE